MSSPGMQNCMESRNFLADVGSEIPLEVSSMITEMGTVLLLVVGWPWVTGAVGSSVGGGFLLPVLGGGHPGLAMSLREGVMEAGMLRGAG